MKTKLRLKQVAKSYGAVKALRPISLEVPEGQFLTLLGPSGSGKSTLLQILAGLTSCDEGEVWIDGKLSTDTPPHDREIGLIFQNYALFPNRTLRQNLDFAAERLPRLERHRRVNEMLDRFRLADVAGRKPHELSGGQKQRCSIARALLAAPRVLLLDEPARGLDIPLRLEFYSVLRQVRSEFATPVLLVTHDLDECFELGDEMLVFRDGRVVQHGPPRKVVDQPANLDVARLPARPDEIKASENAVEQAKAALAQARWRLSQRQLVAPSAGRVSDVLRRVGELAGPSAPVLLMLPDGAAKLMLYVPEVRISGVTTGMKLDVRCDGCAPGLTATVTYVSPEPEFTPPVIYSAQTRQKLVYLVEARPDGGPQSALQPGQIVDVTLRGQR